jgi:hypothetical protein
VAALRICASIVGGGRRSNPENGRTSAIDVANIERMVYRVGVNATGVAPACAIRRSEEDAAAAAAAACHLGIERKDGALARTAAGWMGREEGDWKRGERCTICGHF